jgi:short-subunit dehydrogenase
MDSDAARTTVLITGADTGIGRELVPFFAGTGHNVVLVGREEPVLEGIAAAARHVFRVGASVVACDLAEPDGARTVFAELSRRKVDIDILVNDAGGKSHGEFAAAELQTVERIMQVNIVALTALTKLLLPGMIARGSGKILNVASTAGFVPLPMNSVYGASKAYVLSFSQALAEELTGTGVTVTALCPGPTETEFFGSAGLKDAAPCEGPTMSALSVARMGFHALMRGDSLAVPGWRNFAMISAVRLMPRLLAAKVAKQTMMKRHKLHVNPNASGA